MVRDNKVEKYFSVQFRYSFCINLNYPLCALIFATLKLWAMLPGT